MVETDGTNASDVAKLVLQKGTSVTNLSWNGTTLEIDKPVELTSTLNLPSNLTSSNNTNDVILVGHTPTNSTIFEVKRSIARSELITTSTLSDITSVGTLSSLDVSGNELQSLEILRSLVQLLPLILIIQL